MKNINANINYKFYSENYLEFNKNKLKLLYFIRNDIKKLEEYIENFYIKN